MNQSGHIIGIFNSFNPFPEEPNCNGFYLLYLLDEKGILSREMSEKLYLEKFNSSEALKSFSKGFIGPFESLNTVNQYAFLLCEELNAEKISLISVQEYNAFLESDQIMSDFHRDLLEKGNLIENIDHNKKKNFFNRLFR